MRRQCRYYTLLASLPPLPFFEHAQRLPINRVRLNQRLSMLEAEDWAVVERMLGFLTWQRQPLERTDEEIVAAYGEMADLKHTQPALMDVIEFRMHKRTILSALRRRHQGRPAPVQGEPWGIEPWTRHVVRYWDDPDFKLKAVFPWIPGVRTHLVNGETLHLERMLMRVMWDRIDGMARDDMFGFDALLAYLLKWDILERWLSYEQTAAQTRFKNLMTEAIGDYDRLFD